MLQVKIGDVIEFAPLVSPGKTDGGSGSNSGQKLTTGRVMDVDNSGDGECVVQVSPYEPMQSLDLKRMFYKVVYEAGELPLLPTDMIGWQLEVENMDTRDFEHATVKRVDNDINCAFVVFASGRKEWLDLTLFRIKVFGHPGDDNNVMDASSKGVQAEKSSSVESKTCSSPVRPSKSEAHESRTEGLVVHQREDAPQEKRAVKLSNIRLMLMPSVDPDDLDWSAEGSHVELCDASGNFLEGAAFCSKTGSYLQLYSERREFFEVKYPTQPFKVVIHGLQGLKSIPMGQAVETYSPMVGEFRSGVVLKPAVLGQLTPIRCTDDKAVEWVDLTSQTFKLVFIPRLGETVDYPEDSSRIQQETPYPAPEIDANVDVATPSILVPKLDLQRHIHNGCISPHTLTENTGKLSQTPHSVQPAPRSDEAQHRDPVHKPSRAHLEYLILHVGQTVELFDGRSRQYQKYKVIAFNDWDTREYVFEAIEGSASSSPNPQPQTIVSILPKLRARVILQPSRWEDYRSLLVGHRVDVYDRIGKSVVTGTVQSTGERSSEVENNTDDPVILVRFKDNRKTWIDLRTTKVKLRLNPANKGIQNSDSTGTTTTSSTAADPTTVDTFKTESPGCNNGGDTAVSTAIAANAITADRMVRSIMTQGLARIHSGVEQEEENGDAVDDSNSSTPEQSEQQTAPVAAEQQPSVPRRATAGKRMPPLRRRVSQASEEAKPSSDQSQFSAAGPLVKPLFAMTTTFEEHATSTKATTAIVTPLDFSQLAVRRGENDGDAPNSSNLEAMPRHTTPPASSPTSVQATGGITPSLMSPLSAERALLPVGAVEAAREPNLSLLASGHEHQAEVIDN